MQIQLSHEDNEAPPMKPEKGIPLPNRPDTGVKQDFKNPEKPDEEVPGKPISDMDPPGQDTPDEES